MVPTDVWSGRVRTCHVFSYWEETRCLSRFSVDALGVTGKRDELEGVQRKSVTKVPVYVGSAKARERTDGGVSGIHGPVHGIVRSRQQSGWECGG